MSATLLDEGSTPSISTKHYTMGMLGIDREIRALEDHTHNWRTSWTSNGCL